MVLTAANPYFMPLNACGVTGLQRAPFMCQSWGGGNGGAEVSGVLRQMAPSEDLVWGRASSNLVWVVNVQVSICWALW